MIGPAYPPELAPQDPIESYKIACGTIKSRLPGINTLHPAAIYAIRWAEAASLIDEACAGPFADLDDEIIDIRTTAFASKLITMRFIQTVGDSWSAIKDMSQDERIDLLAQSVRCERQRRTVRIKEASQYDESEKRHLIDVLSRISCYMFSPEPLYLPAPKLLPKAA